MRKRIIGKPREIRIHVKIIKVDSGRTLRDLTEVDN